MVSTVDQSVLELAYIPLVCEFADIFPDDVAGLPPTKEVEFANYLVPGATPIFRASYHLALLEVKELKTQLQVLLEPSVSPWGTLVSLHREK